MHSVQTMGRLARRARRIVRTGRRRLTAALVDLRDVTRVAAARRSLSRLAGSCADTAVVLHLYYPEVWPQVIPYLRRTDGLGVDVFVTLPPQHAAMVSELAATFPGAKVVVVPNRGRDVLPFTVVAERLAELGYVAVLKIHAKRSVHFGAGDRWRDGMLDELLPEDPEVLATILATMRRPTTGVLGPRGSYFALSTYWAGNAATVRRLLGPVLPPDALEALERPQELGFFAGSMFWTRLDAVRPLLHQRTLDFVREPTPKDGALAHALERAMTVLPELLGREQYDCDGASVALRPALAEPLPEWYRTAPQQAKARPAGRAGGAADAPRDA